MDPDPNHTEIATMNSFVKKFGNQFGDVASQLKHAKASASGLAWTTRSNIDVCENSLITMDLNKVTMRTAVDAAKTRVELDLVANEIDSLTQELLNKLNRLEQLANNSEYLNTTIDALRAVSAHHENMINK